MTTKKEMFISVLEENVTIECLCLDIFKRPSVVNLNIILKYLRVKKI